MNALWNSAIGLLVVTGGLLGLTLPFGKIATDAGVPAIVWAFVISLRRGRRTCWSRFLLRGQRIRLNAHRLRYFVDRRGDLLRHAQPADVLGHAASRRRLHRHHVHPVAGHHAGAVDPARRAAAEPARRRRHRGRLRRRGDGRDDARRGRAAGGACSGWRSGCSSRSCLAGGNIYRTIDWPKDTGPIELAVGSHLAAAAMLLAGIVALGRRRLVRPAGRHAAASSSRRWPRRRRCSSSSSGCRRSAGRSISARSAMSRRRSGCFPARCSSASATRLLTWLGAAIIVAGVFMTTKAQSAKA